MGALAVLEAVRKHSALACNGWELRSGEEGFMSCVCLGNPVQISTCPIRLLHASETSANVPLLAFMTSWALKKHFIIWEQLPLSHTQTGKRSNLWAFISTAFLAYRQEPLSREVNKLSRQTLLSVYLPTMLQPFYAVMHSMHLKKFLIFSSKFKSHWWF